MQLDVLKFVLKNRKSFALTSEIRTHNLWNGDKRQGLMSMGTMVGEI
jgi:hypothetical protein